MRKTILSFIVLAVVTMFTGSTVGTTEEMKNTFKQNKITMIGLIKVKSITQIDDNEKQVATPLIEEQSKSEDMGYKMYEVTAYTAGIESTGKRPSDPEYGVTASGKKVKENHTIACPKSLDFGTKIYIPHFDNIFTCEDRGGAIKEGKLDVYMSKLSDALEFGRQKLKVKILKENS